jgi:hypothetical protein
MSIQAEPESIIDHKAPIEEHQNSTVTFKGPPTRKNNYIWQGNFNIWWLTGAIISLWFLFGHGLVLFGKPETNVGPWFAVHLITSTLISFICLWNLFHSPSHGPTYRKIHVILGRISLFIGIISFITGCITAYHERYSGKLNAFIIAVTAGGTMQAISQIVGYIYIRKYRQTGKKSDLEEHIGWMHGVYYGGCLTPAFLRIPEMVGTEWKPWSYFAWIIPLVMLVFAIRAFRKKSVI